MRDLDAPVSSAADAITASRGTGSTLWREAPAMDSTSSARSLRLRTASAKCEGCASGPALSRARSPTPSARHWSACNEFLIWWATQPAASPRRRSGSEVACSTAAGDSNRKVMRPAELGLIHSSPRAATAGAPARSNTRSTPRWAVPSASVVAMRSALSLLGRSTSCHGSPTPCPGGRPSSVAPAGLRLATRPEASIPTRAPLR